MTGGLEISCLICNTPLEGALGAIGRAAGIRRSSQNPNLCNRCDVHVQEGSIVEVAVFFADLTSYTTLTHELGPERTHEVVDAFLRMAKEVVVKWDGFVLQFAGDEIMALFNVPLRCEDYRRRAVAAAAELQRGMADLSERFGMNLQMTVGIAAGHARVGRLGSDDMKDYTAIGDVVNRSARLVSHVEPGGILVDAEVFAGVHDEFPEATPEHLSLKGFAEPVEVVGLGSGGVVADSASRETAARRPFRAAMLMAAMLGAPCAGFLVLNPLILAFGAGAVAASFGTAVVFLDQPAIRWPLISVATLAAVANLLWITSTSIARKRARAAPEKAAGAHWVPSLATSRLGIVLSIGALSMVAFEFVAHAMMH